MKRVLGLLFLIGNLQLMGACSLILQQNDAQSVTLEVQSSTAQTIFDEGIYHVPQNHSITLAAQPASTDLSYRWSKNSVEIPGATSATFNISQFSVSDEGDYTVQISSSDGTTTSLPLRLERAGLKSSWNLSALGTHSSNNTLSEAKIDRIGRSYLVLTFETSIALGGTSLSSLGTGEILIVHLNKDGSLDWARSLGSSASVVLGTAEIDGEDNLWVALSAAADVKLRTFEGTETASINNSGASDSYIVKFDPKGVGTLQYRLSNTTVDFIHPTTSFLYVSGSNPTGADLNVADKNLANLWTASADGSTRRRFVMRIGSTSATSHLRLFTNATSPGSVYAKSLITSAGDFIGWGVHTGSALSVKTDTGTSLATLPDGAAGNIYFSRISPTGSVTYLRGVQSEDTFFGTHAVALDSEDSLAYAARFETDVHIIDSEGHELTELPNTEGGWDTVLLKFSSDGDLEFARSFGGGDGNKKVFGLGFDASHNLYISLKCAANCELYGPGGSLLETLPSSQNPLIRFAPNGTRGYFLDVTDTPASLHVGSEGNVRLLSSGNSAIWKDESGATLASLTSAGSTDAYIAQFAADGSLDFARVLGGTGADTARSLSVDGDGDLFIVLSSTGTGLSVRDTNAVVLDSYSVTGGSSDAPVIRLSSEGSVESLNVFTGTGLESSLRTVLDVNRNPLHLMTSTSAAPIALDGSTLTGLVSRAYHAMSLVQ
jgi:hypothetical protein